MALFRRATPKGRHALGAAVTSIPSGPPAVLPLAAHLPPAAEPVPARLPEPPAAAAAEPAGEPSVMASIAELLATGEAWATDLEDFHARHAPAAMPPAPVASASPVFVPDAVAPLAPRQALLAPPAPQPLVAPVTTPVTAVPTPALLRPPIAVAPVSPATPVHSGPSARVALEAALVDLLPPQGGEPAAAPPMQPPPPRRVQLGFRDGSSATLDPGSAQYQALEELAQSLTRRD